MTRTRSVAVPLVLAATVAVALLQTLSTTFVGGAPAKRVQSRVAMSVGMDYLLRNGPKNADPPLVDVSKARGGTVEIEFKKRPFGVARYAPGINGVGAVVMEVKQQSRYPGDPLGQAFVAGVQPNWIVKSVNGKDVTGLPLEVIMELLDDEVLDPVAAMSLNLKRSGVGTEFKDTSFQADKNYGVAGTFTGAADIAVEKAALPVKIVYQTMS